jgi:TATA-binding protein-associated factor
MESNVDLQSRSAHALAAFLHLCATSSSPALKSPIDKVIKNICVFLCQDDTHTPLFSKLSTREKDILSFNKAIAGALSTAPLRPKDEPVQEVLEFGASHVMRRGGVAAFKQMSILFGSELFSQIPKIWQCISEELLKAYPPESTVESGDKLLAAESGQNFLDTLTALRDILPTLDPALLTRVESLFPSLFLGLQSRYSVVRQAVAKCFAVASDVMTDAAMMFLIERIIPLVDDADLKNRQGAVELLFRKSPDHQPWVGQKTDGPCKDVVNTLQAKALPYIIFLVVPLLGRMSDADEDVRSCATNSFAALIKMVPLEVR